MRLRFGRLTFGLILATTAATMCVPAGNALVLAQEALPSPAAVVKPQTLVSIEPVPRGKSFEIAVVVEIAKGFHMNSHKPTDPYLIPTTLTPQLPSGFDVADTIYPDGHQEKFSFSPNKPLNVYTGKVVLRLKLTAHPDAALGPTTIPMTLRYQACNDNLCRAPHTLEIPLNVNVSGYWPLPASDGTCT